MSVLSLRHRPAGSGPSCHADGTAAAAAAGSPLVALVGAPNCGKSTLFNLLTGSRRTVGNWPGTTVEVGSGAWWAGERQLQLVDLPGAYSLDARSPDEELTRELLLGPDDTGPPDPGEHDRPDLVVLVADAAHLTRSLYLLAQLRERRQAVVVALTMLDVAERRGIAIDVTALSGRLGVPVVALDPRHRRNAERLATTVRAALAAPAPAPRRTAAGRDVGDELNLNDEPDLGDELAVADERFGWIAGAVAAAVSEQGADRITLTDRVDRWATSRAIGPLLFLAVMWCVFQLTTTVAAPLQDGLGALFSGPVTDGCQSVFRAVGLDGSWLQLFVVNGLVAGVGMLLTFVPLMAIMFVLLALLEDSGYLARAAVVTDRVMRTIGLPGRAFLPMVVGFGCNVPAISATRILPSARHRIMTALLVPFTSCSARLTVYVLLASTFFPRHAGTVVFAMYLSSIGVIAVTGLALKTTLWRTVGREPLVLDLPPYQRPTLRLTGTVTWLRLKGFLRTAGGIIVATVSLVWLLQAIPVRGTAGFGSVSPEDSLFAALARLISPLFAPLGFGDWHTSSALVVGFVAKEAVITSWAQTYAAADPTAGLPPHELQAHIISAFQASSGGAVTAAVWAFLLFLLAYTPCVATVAAQRREIGIRWTAFGIVLQLSVAWLLGCAVFQLGRWLW